MVFILVRPSDLHSPLPFVVVSLVIFFSFSSPRTLSQIFFTLFGLTIHCLLLHFLERLFHEVSVRRRYDFLTRDWLSMLDIINLLSPRMRFFKMTWFIFLLLFPLVLILRRHSISKI